MARLKSTLIMNDTFGTVAPVKTKSRATTRLAKITKSVRTKENSPPPFVMPPQTFASREDAQGERDFPIGWTLVGLGMLCAAFWVIVAVVLF